MKNSYKKVRNKCTGHKGAGTDERVLQCACGDYNRTTSYRFVKILEFTHFCSFFNFGRTDVKRYKKQIVDRIHVVVGYRVDTRDTIFFDE